MTKYLFLLFFFGIAVGSIAIIFGNNDAAFGLWTPDSPEELMEQSDTVLVGTITSVDVLEFEQRQNISPRYQSEDGSDKTIDLYTVLVEEFLKNPQESDIITVLQATASRGGPGGVQPVTGFELGDRVLLYIVNTDDNDDYHDGQNQYRQESFVIPESCDPKTVLEQPRLTSSLNDYSIMQEGVAKQDGDDFTVNTPIQFVYKKDMRTLDGKAFDFQITIRKENVDTGKFDDMVLSKKITAASQPCQWIATASVEFTPKEFGNYVTWMHIDDDDNGSQHMSSGEFSVKKQNVAKTATSLKQFNSGPDASTTGCDISNVISEKISIAYSREDVILFVDKNIKDNRKIQEKILYNSVTNQQDVKLTLFAQKESSTNMLTFLSDDCFETIGDPYSFQFVKGGSHFAMDPPRLNQHHDIYVSEYGSHDYKKCGENIREDFVLVRPDSIDKLLERGYLTDDRCRIP